jgi:diguanylate cyclase (GGDEF)-like protein
MKRLFRKEENRRRIRHVAPVLTVGIVGVAVSIFFWYVTATSENHAFVQEFDGRANNQSIILQNGIDDYWDKLYAVRALFDSSTQPITREEFEKFSNSLLKGHAAILNIAWIPRVRREERAAHEAVAVQDGLTDYHIRAIARDGSLPISPERDEYFPKYYSTEARNSPVYGLDLNDGGVRERVVNHIRDGNVLSTSPPLLLHIGQGDRRGFWAGVPVYARGLPHETTEDRRRNLLGIVQGVFQIGVMIDGIFAGVKSPVDLYLFAPNAAVDDLPVYFTSRHGTGSIVAKSQAILATGLHQSFPLNFGDVQWKMVVVQLPAGLMFGGHERSSIMLIFGLLLSGGLSSFVWAMRRYARKVETANAALETSNARFQVQNVQLDAALANMSQGLLMFDSAGKLVISNRHFAELFEVPWEKWEIPALGMTILQAMQLRHDLNKNVSEKNTGEILAAIKRTLDSRARGNVVVERTDGRAFGLSLAPMTNGGYVATFEDITERRRAEDQIAHMAHYDALTDLPNRTLFYERMRELLTGTQQGGTFAVLSMDLDHFKSVNDTLGHPIGDKLLQAVAVRMCSCIRGSDIVARLGGDEFAILQDTLDKPTDAILLATRLTNAVSAPYQIDGHQVIVGTSIGIAIAPRDGSEPDQLMKNADLALYRCKADGGCKYRFFEAKMDRRIQEHHALDLDLRKALVAISE